MNLTKVHPPKSARRLGAALAIAGLMSLMLAPRPAEAQTSPVVDIPVTGVFDGGTFAGTADVLGFENQGGVLVAVLSLTGTLTDVLGNVVGTVTDVIVNLPVTNTAGSSCDILHLELGPLDLDLLGLVVHLNRVVLDIDAEAGSGNLLGNLLCVVARLLDGNASLTAIAQLLNRILDILL